MLMSQNKCREEKKNSIMFRIFLFFIFFFTICSSSIHAWDCPDSVTDPNGDQFTADINLDYPHCYILYQAIQLLRQDGKTNWADIYTQNFQALTDGSTYADAYLGDLVLWIGYECLEIFRITEHAVRVCNYAGFEHYYNPTTGKGLHIPNINALADFLTLPYVSYILVDILGGGTIPGCGLDLELNFDLKEQYPSATDLCEEHYQLAKKNYQGEDLLWPKQSSLYNTMFQVGWASHFIQDLGVVQHLHEDYLGNHNKYDSAPTGLDVSDERYSAQSWDLGKDYRTVSASELAKMTALEVDNPQDYAQSKSDDDTEELRKAVPRGLKAGEQYTAAILAKLMTELDIPPTVPSLVGIVRDYETGRPIPGAFIFYRERYYREFTNPDSPLGAWDAVRTDQNGRATLPLREGTSYLIRPIIPGYKFDGIYASSIEQGDISFTRNGPPFKWSHPISTLDESLECTWFLEPLSLGEEAGPLVHHVVASERDRIAENLYGQLHAHISEREIEPVSALPLSGKPLSVALANDIHRGIMEVVADTTMLAALNNEPISTQLGLVNETYIEIRLSRLADIQKGRILQAPQEIVETVDLAKKKMASSEMIDIAESSTNISVEVKGLKIADIQVPNATSISEQTVQVINDSLSRQQSAALLKHGLIFVPSLVGAEIEVTLASDPGCIGPDFIVSTATNIALVGEALSAGRLLLPSKSLVLTTDSQRSCGIKD